MTKTEFCQALATVDAYNLAVSDLLNAAASDHLELTAEGARKQYEEHHKGGEGACALVWMCTHYDSIAAIVRGASYLAEAAHTIVEPLWEEACKLIQDGQEETPDAGK